MRHLRKILIKANNILVAKVTMTMLNLGMKMNVFMKFFSSMVLTLPTMLYIILPHIFSAQFVHRLLCRN